MRVGEKEVSEQAEIVARYADDLFSRAQLDTLWDAERGASGERREQLYRLRKVCEGGIVSAELVEREDALENGQLAARVCFHGEELPLRAAQARLAVTDDYREREELGVLQAEATDVFNDAKLELIREAEELSAELSQEPDPVTRNEEEKGIPLRPLADELGAPARQGTRRSCACARGGSSACSGRSVTTSRGRTTCPTSAGSRRSRRSTPRTARPTSAWRR